MAKLTRRNVLKSAAGAAAAAALPKSLGARVLNLFFLVRTGRGQDLIDITPDQYEQLLTYLARVQGVGNGEGRKSPQAVSIFDCRRRSD